MNNQLLRSRPAFLYTIYGQSYQPADPGKEGYWRTVVTPTTNWVKVKVVFTFADDFWSLYVTWYDPYLGKNGEWFGMSSVGQVLSAPFAMRERNGYKEIELPGAPRKESVWVPPVPPRPEQPYIPDQYIYEDSSGWDSGAHGVKPIPLNSGIAWSISPKSRGVVAGLSESFIAGTYWRYRIGVMAQSGIASVVVDGVEVAQLGAFTESTVFEIDRFNGAFQVYVNKQLKYSLADSSTEQMLFDVSLYTTGDNVFNPRFTHFSAASGALPSLNGLVLGDGIGLSKDEGLVALNVQTLIGSAEDHVMAIGQAQGQLAPITGFAASEADYALAYFESTALQGSALGFSELPWLGDRVALDADMPKISIVCTSAPEGVKKYTAAFLHGVISDDADLAQYYGTAPLPNIFSGDDIVIEGEDTGSDVELRVVARATVHFFVDSIESERLNQKGRAHDIWTFTELSVAEMVVRARARAEFRYSETSYATLLARARFAASERPSLPHEDADVTTLVCHESGGFVTQYTAFNFQSFAKIGDEVYGVAADGVYLLSGGTDDGRPITAHIDLGTNDFHMPEIKSLAAVYADIASKAPAKLNIKTRQGEFTYPQRKHNPQTQTQRFDVGRGLRDTHYDLSLEAPADGLRVEAMEFEVQSSARKI